MGILEQFNSRVGQYTFELEESKRVFYSLSDLANNGITEKDVKGLFINKKGKYGDNAVVVSNDCFVSLPHHLTETVETMIYNETITEMINNDKVYFKIRPCTKEGKTYYSIKWMERN